MAKQRIVLEFDLSKPQEKMVFNYLSRFGNGKKAVVLQAVTFLMKQLGEDTEIASKKK